jgi:hypothetical protein
MNNVAARPNATATATVNILLFIAMTPNVIVDDFPRATRPRHHIFANNAIASLSCGNIQDNRRFKACSGGLGFTALFLIGG